MGKRITDLGSEEFGKLFTDFEHTAYRLETLPAYDVTYEGPSWEAWQARRSFPHDPARDAWTGMIRDAVAAGKRFQRVHVVSEPLTDYLRYEFENWYTANTAAGDDVRILTVAPGEWPAGLTCRDYWLFDSRDLWAMHYADNGTFEVAEQVTDPGQIVLANYWRDVALHHAIPFEDYMRRSQLRRAS